MLKTRRFITVSTESFLGRLFYYVRRLRLSDECGIFTELRECMPLQDISCIHIIFLINLQWTAVVPKPVSLDKIP